MNILRHFLQLSFVLSLVHALRPSLSLSLSCRDTKTNSDLILIQFRSVLCRVYRSWPWIIHRNHVSDIDNICYVRSNRRWKWYRCLDWWNEETEIERERVRERIRMIDGYDEISHIHWMTYSKTSTTTMVLLHC